MSKELKCIDCGSTVNLSQQRDTEEFPVILCKKCRDNHLNIISCRECNKSGVELYNYDEDMDDQPICYECFDKKEFKEIKQEGDK